MWEFYATLIGARMSELAIKQAVAVLNAVQHRGARN
jgi:hypothetical protein